MKHREEAGQRRQTSAWWDRVKEQLKGKAVRFVAAGMALVLAGGIGYYALTRPNAYAVMIDGEPVAYVAQETEAVDVIEKLLQEKSVYGPVRHLEEVTYAPVRVKKEELSAAGDLKRILADNLSFVAEATAIIVDGREVGIVPDFATAQRIIASIKQKYMPDAKEGLSVETVAFEENIVFEPRECAVDAFSDPEVLEELLYQGTEKMETYTVVEGDSLWTIARRHGMTVEELKAANPELKSELLSIGQELKLVKAEPLLHVVTTYSLKKEETIPYKTTYEADDSMYRGQERVKKPGVPGQKSVVYRIVERNGRQVSKEVVAEKVIKEPQDKIVLRGTKVMIASRGDGGSGELAWPIRGTISSRFGYRGREFHSGVDIGAPKGTPIGAAEAGTVIFAGRSGNYGLMVDIDHGNGLVTRYAHCSELKVKVGDQVTRGQVIATVGATGRATGNHVHFEVRVNGVAKNPLNYLR